MNDVRGSKPIRTRNKIRVIKADQTENILKAAQFAGYLKRPLNRFITINWNCYESDDKSASAYTTDYLKRITCWLSNNGTGSAYVWVREKAIVKGNHVHILIHVRPEQFRALRKMNYKWLKAITGKPYKRGAINSKIVGRNRYQPWLNPDAYDAHLKWLLIYMLKCLNANVAEQFSVTMRGKSLPMTQKVCGYSQSLSANRWPKGISFDNAFLAGARPPDEFVGKAFIEWCKNSVKFVSLEQ